MPRSHKVKYRGRTFRSKLELWVHKQLQKLKNGYDFKFEYESEKIPYQIKRNYVPDFIVTLSNGHKVYVEAKGYFSPADRAKIKAVVESNPKLDLRIVFARDNLLTKRAKSTYTQWCDKLGIPWAINSPPKEWFRK